MRTLATSAETRRGSLFSAPALERHVSTSWSSLTIQRVMEDSAMFCCLFVFLVKHPFFFYMLFGNRQSILPCPIYPLRCSTIIYLPVFVAEITAVMLSVVMVYFVPHLPLSYGMTHDLSNAKCNQITEVLPCPCGQMEPQPASCAEIVKSCDVRLTPLSSKETAACPVNWRIQAVVWLMSESRFDLRYVIHVYGV